MSFVSPDRAVSVSTGSVFTIQWADSDPDDNALIDLVLDPDSNHDSGNELLILSGRGEDGDLLEDDSFEFDTSAVPVGNYVLRAVIDDGSNPPVLVEASGSFDIVPLGTAPLNAPPTVQVVAPAANRSVANGDVLLIRWVDEDPDDNALVLITLDLDDNPDNDDPLNLTPSDGIFLTQKLEDADTADPNDPADDADMFRLDVDVTQIPMRQEGLPYYVKATLIDGNNPPVHAYAPGLVYVLALAEPELTNQLPNPVDLGRIGTVISGATFQGIHGGDWVGSRSRTIGDFDADGADDFVLVARYGSPVVGAPVGQAYVVYGLPPVDLSESQRGERFGGKIGVTEVSAGVSGVTVHAPYWMLLFYGYDATNDLMGGPNLGITDVGFLPDDTLGISGDGRPEIVFGLPHVDGMISARDDDPGDSAEERTFQVSATVNTTAAEDSYGADDAALAANCNADRLVVGPGLGDSAFIQFVLADLPLREMQEMLMFGGDVDATVTLTVAVPDEDLRVLVRGFVGDDDPADPYAGVCVESPQADFLSVEIEPEQAFDAFGEVEIDFSDYVQLGLQEFNRVSLIIGLTPTTETAGGGSVQLFSLDSGAAGPRLEITINPDEFVVGCYIDPYVNNFSSSDPGDDPEDNGGTVLERNGAAFIVYSSNRDNDPLLVSPPAERFESTSIRLDDVGQQDPRLLRGATDTVVEGGDRVSGSRVQVGLYDWYREDWIGTSNQGPLQAHYGRTVDCLPDMNNDGVAEFVISAPRNEADWQDTFAVHGWSSHVATRTAFGNVQVYFGQEFAGFGEDWFPGRRGDTSNSVIPWLEAGSARCGESSDDRWRDLSMPAGEFTVFGETPEDELGYARFGGDFDGNGTPDLAMGAPLADVNLMAEAGKAYLWFSTPSAQGPEFIDLDDLNDPNPTLRPDVIRIHGEHPGDHLGGLQGLQQDFDGNGVDDWLIATGDYDWNGLADTGAIAVVLGFQWGQAWARGDYMFTEIGDTLPGVIFYGGKSGDRAGADACGSAFYDSAGVTSGADFNGDGFGDLLIVAPGATGSKNGQARLGVVYLIFGRSDPWDPVDPANNIFSLDQVGTSLLPGMVFVSPHEPGTADEAAPLSASFLGDVNVDGFADIMIGNPLADFVSDFDPAIRGPDAGEAYLIYGNNSGCSRLQDPDEPVGPDNPENACGFMK